MLPKKQDKLNRFYFELGSNIKKYREKAGLSMEQLGFEMGISKGDIHTIEKGKNITILTLLKISIILEVPLINFVDYKHHLTISDIDELVKTKKVLKIKKSK